MDQIYREELLRALEELKEEEEVRRIKDRVGNMFAEVKVHIEVNWFDTLTTENISKHLVIGDSEVEVTTEFDKFFREIADTDRLLAEIKQGLISALEDGGQLGTGEESSEEEGGTGPDLSA